MKRTSAKMFKVQVISIASGGSRGCSPEPTPTDQYFLNFMQFLEKSGKFVCWRPLRVGAPSYGKSGSAPDCTQYSGGSRN